MAADLVQTVSEKHSHLFLRTAGVEIVWIALKEMSQGFECFCNLLNPRFEKPCLQARTEVIGDNPLGRGNLLRGRKPKHRYVVLEPSDLAPIAKMAVTGGWLGAVSSLTSYS